MNPRIAVALVVLLLPYTGYFAVDPDGFAGAVLGLVPGVVGLGLLLAAGPRRGDCFLRLGRASRSGLVVLAAVTLLLLPALLLVVDRAPVAAGLGWGGRRCADRTVVWAMVQHTSFLMPMTRIGPA